jgi:uncharacterized protein involved in exopolysaccharide biosynthesis
MSGNRKQEPMDVPGVRKALWRRRRFIFTSVAVFGALGLVLNVLTPPLYRATARLEVRKPPDHSSWTGQSLGSTNYQSENVALYTNVELMTNREILTRLADDLYAPGNVLADREPASWLPKWLRVPVARASGATGHIMNASFGAPDPLRQERQLETLTRQIRVQPVKDTRLVDLVVEDSDPEVAKTIANRLAQMNLEYQGRRQVQEDTTGYAFLQGQIADVKSRIDASSKALLSAGGGQLVEDARAEQMRSTVAGLSQAYVQAEAERVAASSRLSRLGAYGPDDGNDRTGVPMDNENSTALRRSLMDVQTQIAAAQGVYGDMNPKLIALKEQEKQLQSQVASETKRSIAGLRGESSVLTARSGALRAAMEKAQGTLVATEENAQRMTALEGSLKADQDLYQRLLSRAHEAGYEQQLTSPQLNLVSPASVEMEPVRPRPIINLLVCLAAGLLVGTGFALAREAGRRTVQYPEDVERQLDLPVLAVLPKTA